MDSNENLKNLYNKQVLAFDQFKLADANYKKALLDEAMALVRRADALLEEAESLLKKGKNLYFSYSTKSITKSILKSLEEYYQQALDDIAFYS